jgi:hypothetical protein
MSTTMEKRVSIAANVLIILAGMVAMAYLFINALLEPLT